MQLSFFAGAIIGMRSEQQDSYTHLALPNGYYLFVLADGMGGHAGGELASRAVCSAFYSFFYNCPEIRDPDALLNQALTAANQAVAGAMSGRNDLRGMGSTVIALLIHEPTGLYHFISVGDSPLYRFKNNRLTRINANHAYYETLLAMVDKGLMSKADADNHPNRHAINSAIMGEAIPHIDRQNGVLTSGEYLLLASDGLQSLDDSPQGTIASLMARESQPELAIRLLLSSVEQARLPHQDNTTAIVVALDAPLQTPNHASFPDFAPAYASANDRLQAAPLTTAEPPPPQLHIEAERPTHGPGLSFIQRRAGLIIGLLCLLVIALLLGLLLLVFKSDKPVSNEQLPEPFVDQPGHGSGQLPGNEPRTDADYGKIRAIIGQNATDDKVRGNDRPSEKPATPKSSKPVEPGSQKQPVEPGSKQGSKGAAQKETSPAAPPSVAPHTPPNGRPWPPQQQRGQGEQESPGRAPSLKPHPDFSGSPVDLSRGV